MYIMYVDESGDTGMNNSPTKYFVLSGIVIHEIRWRDYLDQIVDFRRRMKNKFGLHMREEIHSANFISNPGKLSRIPKSDRLTIIRNFAYELSSMTDLNVINIVVDKSTKPPGYDVFDMAWKVLIQRFENTLSYNNFRGPHNTDDKEMLICDNTDAKSLIQLVRRMRKFNPIPNNQSYGIGYRNQIVRHIIEDPDFRNSKNSYFVQAADLVAFLLYQHITPNAYMKKKSGNNYFYRINSILCKVASTNDPYGIVWL
jgi:hypothetical protein